MMMRYNNNDAPWCAFQITLQTELSSDGRRNEYPFNLNVM